MSSENQDPKNGPASSQKAPRITPLGDNRGVHIASDEPAPSHPAGAVDAAIDFGGFVISLGTSCMVNLGKYENPETGRYEKDLEAARQVIQILEMLQKKTRGNLEPEEERLIGSLIYDLRMAFVEASNA